MRLPGTLKQLVDGLTALGLTPTAFQFDADGHLLALQTQRLDAEVETEATAPKTQAPSLRPKMSAIESIRRSPPPGVLS